MKPPQITYAAWPTATDTAIIGRSLGGRAPGFVHTLDIDTTALFDLARRPVTSISSVWTALGASRPRSDAERGQAYTH